MTLPIIQQCVCKSDQQPVIENILKQFCLGKEKKRHIYQRSSARSVHPLYLGPQPASLQGVVVRAVMIAEYKPVQNSVISIQVVSYKGNVDLLPLGYIY